MTPGQQLAIILACTCAAVLLLVKEILGLWKEKRP